MKKFMPGHGKRLGAASAGLVVANFIFALLVNQFGVDIHPNVVASGTGIIMLIVNGITSKYFS